jgi:hypothetical protein
VGPFHHSGAWPDCEVAISVDLVGLRVLPGFRLWFLGITLGQTLMNIISSGGRSDGPTFNISIYFAHLTVGCNQV